MIAYVSQVQSPSLSTYPSPITYTTSSRVFIILSHTPNHTPMLQASTPSEKPSERTRPRDALAYTRLDTCSHSACFTVSYTVVLPTEEAPFRITLARLVLAVGLAPGSMHTDVGLHAVTRKDAADGIRQRQRDMFPVV